MSKKNWLNKQVILPHKVAHFEIRRKKTQLEKVIVKTAIYIRKELRAQKNLDSSMQIGQENNVFHPQNKELRYSPKGRGRPL